MKSIHRTLFPVVAGVVFCVAFLAGRSPADIGPALGGGNSDAIVTTLPPDVQSRLGHVAPVANKEDFRPAVTFWEVLSKVKSRYVDRIDDQNRLTNGAVGSMLRALRDPYSQIMNPDEIQLAQQQSAGTYSGLGVILGARLSGPLVPVVVKTSTLKEGPPRRPAASDALQSWQLVVVDVVPGSAAARGGLRTGDVISKVNGDRIERPPLAGKSLDDLNEMLNSSACHEATLTVYRPGSSTPVDIKMTGGDTVKVPAVSGRMLSHGDAYIRIYLFTETTAQELNDVLNKLSAQHPTGLMLDLRDNPGGMLDAAEHVIGALAPGGTIGILDGREKSQDLPALASTPVPVKFSHVVVLTNAGTANVAELVAGCLRERMKARLVGAPTFGNGLVQTIYPLNDGWEFSLTTGRLRTPMGVSFNQHGLSVDRTISPNALQGDNGISAAMPVLMAMK